MSLHATARLRFVSIPPRKMRLVANMVKGLPIEKALNILNFTPRIAAYHIAKTLKSAAANALSLEGTDNLKPEDLVVKNIVVDAAPTAKRIRFQSMGRIYRYRKRYCHLTVVLEEKAGLQLEKAVEAPKTKTQTTPTEEKKTGKTKDKKKKTVKKTASAGKKTSSRTDTKSKKAAIKKQKVI